MFYASMVFPGSIQTDNGTSYTGKEFKEMCQKYNIKHITGNCWLPMYRYLSIHVTPVRKLKEQ